MAGQLKEVRNRIKSVQSTQQITKAMKMVSAAKLRRAQDAIIQMRPYASKLQEVLSNIVSNTEGGTNMALAEERQIKKVLLVVITSDRGLCGAYNANIQKMALVTIKEKYSTQYAEGNLTIWAIGKKGAEFFQKRGYHVDVRFKDIFMKLSFEAVQLCAQAAVQAFTQKEFDAVEIIYSEFKNAATQRFAAEPFLPIPKNSPVEGKSTKKSDFIFGNHRSHAHYLALGGSLFKLFAEILGKSDGCSGGKGGSMHITSPENGFIGSMPIVAGTIPIALGGALTCKISNNSSISVSYFGDGAAEEGIFYESLNFAALHNLPLVIVLEDNLYSVNIVVILYNILKFCFAKSKFYGANIWYVMVVIKFLDHVVSEIF
jgi:F-type H+-transporting ATPase subunit gamma